MTAQKPIISLVAGGAGFIGVNLSRALLEANRRVIIADNLSLGSEHNIRRYVDDSRSEFFKVDLSEKAGVDELFERCVAKFGRVDEIWHMAANSDIPAGVHNPEIDLRDTFLTTFRLLDAASKFGVKRFHFASSSAVYGDWNGKRLTEALGPLKPISNYGAMKLASEAQICAAAEDRFENVNIFRFPNVVGMPATHGVIIDFINKVHSKDTNFEVLGNGSQKKSYLHVSELVSAMLYIVDLDQRENRIEIINVGCDDTGIKVSEIAEIVKEITKTNKWIVYGEQDRGWSGDVPRFSYDVSYLSSRGWSNSLTSREAVVKAAREIYLSKLDSING